MDNDFLQIFSDEAVVEASSQSEEAQQAESVREEFEGLIKGKYADAFRERTQGIIDKRFAKMKGYEKTAKALSPLLGELRERFPDIDKADTEGLVNAYLADKNRTEENEEASKEGNGTPVSETNEKEPTREEKFSRAVENAAKNKAALNLARLLNAESEKLREIYPSFDLKGEIDSNPEFLKLLESGVSLKRAYETVNLERIMSSALKYAVMQAGKNAADAIKNNTRESESSVASKAASVKRTDVNSLTEKEIHKILSQVSKGAKIKF